MSGTRRVDPHTSDCRESALQLGLPEQGGRVVDARWDVSLHITSGSGLARRAGRPEILPTGTREICTLHICTHLGSPRAGVERGSSGSARRERSP